jgi:hypothetical protein
MLYTALRAEYIRYKRCVKKLVFIRRRPVGEEYLYLTQLFCVAYVA